MPKPANKPIIAVDIDEVLFPMVPDLIDYLDREHRVAMTHQDFEKYHFEDVWHGGPDEASIIFEKYISQTTVDIVPVKGAAESLRKLSKNYEIVVMTARDEAVSERTLDWINRHFPGLFRDVHFVGNKFDSKVWRPKAEVCVELEISWLIDDNLKTILQTHEAGVGSILFGDYAWNQMKGLPKGITRAKDWQEVLEYFDGRDN